MKRFLAALLAVMMLAALMPTVSLAASQYATVVGGWLRLRAGASFEADTITSYYTDTVVEILGSNGNWYNVRTPDGRLGYMYGDFLRLGTPGGSGNAFVTSHNGYGVRLRKGPGTGYRIIRTYAVGTPVTVLERGNYWCKISINGTVGYMMTQFLNFGSDGGNGNQSVVCYASVWSGNGYGVRLRTGPGKEYSKIGVYSVGTSVAVLEKGAVWDRIRVGSRTGWMMNEFLVYQNANEVTDVSLNTLNPTVGTVLKAQYITPSSATVAYSWLVDGVVKGTNATYTVSAADVGKTIKLKVTGIGNYSGNVTSAQTNPVISNTQISSVRLNTTAPVVGDVLKVTVTPNEATVAYAWKVDGYQVSNDAEYTVLAEDAGKVIEVIVTGTGSYSGMQSVSTSPVAAFSSISGVTIVNESNPTGAAPMVGDALKANVSPAQATVLYQWYSAGEAISGANAAGYTITDADLGKRISVAVQGTGAYSGSKTAEINEPVAQRPEQPQIDEADLTDATVGQYYAVQLTAQGGGQIAWSLNDGALPAGITLAESGVLSGTPSAEGEYTFTVTATNRSGSDEYTFTLKVLPEPKAELVVGAVNIPARMEGYEQAEAASVTITNSGNAAAELVRLYTSGGHAEHFVVNEDGRSRIAAGATDSTWTVRPVQGLAAGTYTTQFVVEYDAGKTAVADVTFVVNAVAEGAVLYQVTVNNGSADYSTCEAGTLVTLTADAPAAGKVFSGWTADGAAVFADASSVVTTFVMPEADVTVTATYADEVVRKANLEAEEIILPALEEGYNQPAPVKIILTNSGNADARIKALYTEGGDSGSFTVNEDGRSTVAAGATDDSWTLQPKAGLAEGVYRTTFVIEYDDTRIECPVTLTVMAKPTYQLTVENGSGTGSYAAGERVTLKADAPAEGMVFDYWSATAGTLVDASAMETAFTMPAQAAQVTAVYRAME